MHWHRTPIPRLDFAPIFPKTRLQIGRAYAMARDTAKAKSAYQDFITLSQGTQPRRRPVS